MVSIPSVYPRLATSGTRTAPSPTREGTGYDPGEALEAHVFNHLVGVGSDWDEWLEQERAAMVARVDAMEAAQGFLNEVQAAHAMKVAFSLGANFVPRDICFKSNALGSLAGFLVVGDASGGASKLATRVGGTAVANRTPGSSFTGNFSACVTDSNGIYIAVGADKEAQSSGDGITFTRRSGTGAAANDFYCIATSGTALLMGGQSGELQYATAYNGTYSSRTSPDGSNDIIHLGWDSTSSLWILVTRDKIYTSNSATAANGTWTLKLTLSGTGTPQFLDRRCAQGGLGWSFIASRNADDYAHAYSSDHGATFSITSYITASFSHGNEANIHNALLDRSMLIVDSTAAASGPVTLGLTKTLSHSVIMTQDHTVLYSVLQDNVTPERMRVFNNQVWLLCHTVGFDGYIMASGPYNFIP